MTFLCTAWEPLVIWHVLNTITNGQDLQYTTAMFDLSFPNSVLFKFKSSKVRCQRKKLPHQHCSSSLLPQFSKLKCPQSWSIPSTHRETSINICKQCQQTHTHILKCYILKMLFTSTKVRCWTRAMWSQGSIVFLCSTDRDRHIEMWLYTLTVSLGSHTCLIAHTCAEVRTDWNALRLLSWFRILR